MLSGAFTALITPFDETGQIDYPGVARLLAWHEANGMDGVVVAGTNGEGPSLSAIEKRDLVRFAVQHAGKLQVILGAGTCSITQAIWLCEQAQKAGAIASLVLPPFYFDASKQGIRNWFDELLSKTDLPCIVYNFPKMTRFTFDETLVHALFQNANCIGIKDSSGDEHLLDTYLRVAHKHSKSVFVGDERLILNSLLSEGSGTISGLANSFPALISRQVREKSDALQTFIDEAVQNIKCHPQPAVHKAILDHRGLPGGPMRPPLESLDENARNQVIAFVDSFNFQ